MSQDFLQGVLGNTGIEVHRLGLSASYRPGKKTIYKALDEGLNFFFYYGFDWQMTDTLRDLFKTRRSDIVVATGPYNLIWGHSNIRRTLERRLKQLRTDYIDIFLFLGVMKPKQLPDYVLKEMRGFREEGKVRAIGLSTHDRKLAGKLAAGGEVDILMIRYNAAHRGAEQDIFPYLSEHDPGLISYTATRWTYLLRQPKGWQRDRLPPSAGLAYRFVLSNQHVDVCLTAPRNEREFLENLAAVRQGPLCAEEMEFMREFGNAVHSDKKWFM